MAARVAVLAWFAAVLALDAALAIDIPHTNVAQIPAATRYLAPDGKSNAPRAPNTVNGARNWRDRVAAKCCCAPLEAHRVLQN